MADKELNKIEDELTKSQLDRVNKKLKLENSIMDSVDSLIKDLTKQDELSIIVESNLIEKASSDNSEDKLTTNQMIKILELKQNKQRDKLNTLTSLVKGNETHEINIPIDFGNKVDPNETKEAMKVVEDLKKLKEFAKVLEETENN